MKLEQVFVASEWEETGEMGFMPEPCSEAFNPLSYAPGLAHDFIEHAGDFSVEGEIKAHASMYFIRYEGGMADFSMQTFAYEWDGLYRGIAEEGCLVACEPQERLDEAVESDLAEIISKGKRLLLSEYEKEYICTDTYTQLSRYYADWFRKGYREAQERYKAIGRHGAWDAFQVTLELFQRALREELVGCERITVTLDLESGEVNSKHETECWTCGHYCEEEKCQDCLDYDEE